MRDGCSFAQDKKGAVSPLKMFSVKRTYLPFSGHHLCDFQVLLELALGDPFEGLVEVWLNGSRFLRLRQDLQ